MFARVLRKECVHLKFTPAFLFTTRTIHSVSSTGDGSVEYIGSALSPQAVRSRISSAKNQYLSPASGGSSRRRFYFGKVSAVYAEYQKTLQQSNAMDLTICL